MQHTVDVNCPELNGDTALIMASARENVDAVSELLKHDKVDVNCQNRHGDKALTMACKINNLDIVCELLNHEQADVNLRDRDNCIPHGKLGHCSRVVETRRYGRKRPGWTALAHSCSRTENMDVVRKLLLHDTVDVNCQARNGRAALSMACDARSHDVVRELLKHNKMHVNCRDGPGDTALTMACKPNNVHFVWELVDRDDGSGLFKLVYRRVENLNMIREVLEHDKVDVNAKDHGGRTALYWASYSGLWGAIEILLQYDEVDVNAKGAHGNTALVWACLKGRLDIVCKLLKDGRVDTSIRNKAGSTALDVARNLELIEITSCLEEHDKSCLRRKPEVKIAQEDVLNWKE